MKLALILSVIDPNIGGVIIMGHRGTGKSTAVRALADLLPPIAKVKGCIYGCDPDRVADLCQNCAARLLERGRLPRERRPVEVIDLPLGATEDRVCGTLDIEKALTEGVKSFELGLLARANRGFLYIDEVNLLEDHLVDVLLDAAASGRNTVEREGISVSHPARFVLVGSGNPEEGELRPQLLDRFGLYTQITTITDPDKRVEIVERRERFERDPAAFRAEARAEQDRLRRQLTHAKKMLARVEVDRKLLRQVAEVCVALKVDGHRGELTIARAARALAAFEGRANVSADDARRVAPMSLRHRLRKDPLERIESGAQIEQALDDLFPKTTGENSERESSEALQSNGTDDLIIRAVDSRIPDGALALHKQTGRRARSGKRVDSQGFSHGRYVQSVARDGSNRRVAIDATLRAAAPFQLSRQKQDDFTSQCRVQIVADDLRYKKFKRRSGILFIFAVDASGSMAMNRMAQAKGALTRLLQDVYLHRDKVALISFRGEGAQILLAPTRSVEVGKRLVDALPAGGGTPIAAGLLEALELVRTARAKEAAQAMLVLFTDGRANVGLRREKIDATAIQDELKQIGAALRAESVASVVIDTKSKFISGGEGLALAEALGGRYLYLPRADAATIYTAITSAAENMRHEIE